MQSENKLFEDFTKFVNGAAGTLAGMGREMEANSREKFREWLGGLDFVSREEFEAVKAMATKALDEVEALTARVTALEGAKTPVTSKAKKSKTSDEEVAPPIAGLSGGKGG